jgi:hypothetical protein
MGIGAGIFLIAVGAILTFAVHTTVNGISIQAVGVILMIAGALGLIVTMTIFAPRRRTSVVEERYAATPVDPAVRETVVERHDVY